MGRKNGESGKISITILTSNLIPESRNNDFPGYAFRKGMIILSKDQDFSDKETLDIARKFCKAHKKDNDAEIPLNPKEVNKNIRTVLRAA
ncbi:hypothetical protein BMS3Abin15_00719 [bacterium BMS3Abin15]|nr:hypothetical protein BMS3Abin15_00719 [bacterium BMS3Abin15]HDH07796.1 hypothetical protein [Candidatus Moranbacteria bacterium]HDZ85936.1 hypothetical protein [Candidatus Moranbacteria bacterium]